nr:reverse transcriptase domain-containing protein [Tanacetum cinerariifolium]
MQNQLTNLTDLLTKFVNSNNVSTSSSGTLPSNTIANSRSDLKVITTRSVYPTNNESTEDVQPQVVQSKSLILTSEPVNSPIIKPVASPVSAPRPNQRPSIPYPSRMHDQKLRELTLRVGKEAITFNLDQTSRYSANYIDMMAKRIDVIDMTCKEYSQEVLGFSDVIASGNPTPYYDSIVSTTFSTLTPFENSDFLLEEVDAFLALEDDPTSSEVDQSYLDSEWDILLLGAFLNDDPLLPPPNQGNYLPKVRKELKICEAKSKKSLIDEPLEVKLKDLPPCLEYVLLEGDDKLPVIIVKHLNVEEKTALITVLKSHKRAIAWKLSDIKGIDPEFCTHKILMEEDFEPAVQHQRRVNSKIHDVIKQEVLKLLDAGLIYPISDSSWVSPVHCILKKGGFTVVENEDNELILTHLITDQMLERLAGNRYYCFLDGFSGYFQIPIDSKDQEKTTFTCPYGMFAYRCMPFGLRNAPCTFQSCLSHLEKMLKRCKDTNLCLNWEKSHFMVKEGIVLGHKISKQGIEVDKAKVDVITKLSHPTTVKGIRSFLGHAGFYRRFIKDFSKIARPMTRLLEKDTPFHFSKECVEAFQTLKRKLTEASISIAHDWDRPFELMCNASDFSIGAVLGQHQDKHFRPIHYASKTTTEAKSNYTTTKKEMLAVVYAFKKFSSYLIMNKSIVYTDHFALKYLFAKKDLKSSEGVYTARKPLTLSRLATMDPPGDTMALFTQPRRGKKYILVAVDYLSKWVEAKADRGTHLCNDQFAKVMQKFGVTHRLETPYHLQTRANVEVSNHGLKRILERIVGENRASWSDKLDDALWSFQTAYKTPIECTPYKLVYGKACHLLIKLEHKSYWALKHANFNLQIAGDHRKVQLNELNELRDQAYENSLIYKEKTNRLHDSKIKNRVFNIGDKVLLFNSRLKIFSSKLKSH